MRRNKNIIPPSLYSNPKSSELSRNNTQLVISSILNCNLTGSHCRQPYETTNLNHIRKNRVLSTVQRGDTLYRKQVRAYSRNLRPHTVQHLTKLLQIRFTGSIVNSGLTLSQNSSHYNICRACHRSLIKEHVTTLQPISFQLKKAADLFKVKLSPEFLKTNQVSIKASSPDLITTRFRHICKAKTCEQRANKHNRAPQCRR